MNITKAHKTEWGSYTDRTNSYDDSEDIKLFFNMVKKDKSLKEYLSSFLPAEPEFLRKHPNGDFGVDIGIMSKNKIVATIDVERWRPWKEDWPSYYKYIHFLGRKEKFLNEYKVPFFMAFMNYSMTKVLMISEQDIRKYPTKPKTFASGITDRVRELSMSDGHVFGENITKRERELFQ